jgi:NDP-sugar pyrophosphorylase family protein
MKAAIIAAGQGERFAHAGVPGPKPLIKVAGLALIDHTLNSVRASGLSEVVIIINEQSSAVEQYCRDRVTDLRLTFVRRTTPSSMESLFTLAPHLVGGRFLLLTIDAIVAPVAVRRFTTAATARVGADGVLALNTFVDDEKPLRVTCAADGKIAAIGATAAGSPLVTAGLYMFRPTIFAEIDAARAAGFTALRQFLGHLVHRSYRLFGERVPKCVDVDRPHDIAAAEAFVRSGYAI